MSRATNEGEDAGALDIEGGHPLRGTIKVSGSKNAALPIIAAALLVEGTSVLRGVPNITDVRLLLEMLEDLDVKSHCKHDILFLPNSIASDRARKYQVSSNLARKMRASLLLLGPCLARLGKIAIPLPGGCAIGTRPIEEHIYGLRQLGAEVMIEWEEVVANCRKGSLDGSYTFTVPTVTGTATLMLAASLSDRFTCLRNVAKEPEIEDLAKVLKSMGVRIQGAGTAKIIMQGTPRPTPYSHDMMSDRIECGTFMIAGALLGDPLLVDGVVEEQHAAFIAMLRSIGAGVSIKGQTVSITSPRRNTAAVIRTSASPGIATDLQPQLMALQAYSIDTSVITESVYENRFKHVPQLQRMGANITVNELERLLQAYCFCMAHPLQRSISVRAPTCS